MSQPGTADIAVRPVREADAPALVAIYNHYIRETIVTLEETPNEASVALHEKFGLRRVAYFPEVGFKFGRWVDVGFWHRVL